jgi:hypothetical protein
MNATAQEIRQIFNIFPVEICDGIYEFMAYNKDNLFDLLNTLKANELYNVQREMTRLTHHEYVHYVGKRKIDTIDLIKKWANNQKDNVLIDMFASVIVKFHNDKFRKTTTFSEAMEGDILVKNEMSDKYDFYKIVKVTKASLQCVPLKMTSLKFERVDDWTVRHWAVPSTEVKSNEVCTMKYGLNVDMSSIDIYNHNKDYAYVYFGAPM